MNSPRAGRTGLPPTVPPRPGGARVRRLPSVLAVLLLVALAAPASLPAQSIKTPLEIAEVAFDHDRFMIVDGEAVERLITVTVRNNGERASTAYELHFEWMSPSGSRTPLRANAASSVDTGPAMVSAGEHEHDPLSWAPLDSQVGPGHIVVSVREGGDSREHPPIPVFVERHAMSVEVDDLQPLTIGPEETLHIPLTVTNEGNVPVDVTWALTEVHSRLRASFQEPTKTYDADDTGPAVLVVTYPFAGSTEDLIDLTVEAVASTPEGLAETVTSPEIDILHADEPAPPSFDLEGPGRTQFAEAGQTIQVPFTLTNTGGSPDTYTFTRAATNGWSAAAPTVDGQTVQQVSLAAGASRELELPVTAAAGAGRVAGVSLTATSQGDVTDTATANLALAGPLPVINNIAFTQKPLYVGDDAVVRVVYANAGDATLEDANLVVRAQYAAGGLDTRTVTIPDLLPDRDRSVTIDLGRARAAGQVRITAELTDGTETALGNTVTLVHSGRLTVTPPDPVVGTPGERVLYHTLPHAFQVRNDGNADEDITVAVQGATLLGDASFQLKAGQTRTLAVTQSVPGDVGDANTVPVTLTATLDNDPERGADATVHTPVQDDAAPSVTWSESPETMLPSDARPVRVQADDDTYVHKTWVEVAPTGPDVKPSDTLRVELTDAGSAWIGLLRSGLPGTYEMTPKAEDAFGNVGVGPVRTLEVTHRPELPAPAPTLDEVRYENGTLTVKTDGAAVRVLLAGNETLHDVVAGRLELDLPLGAGTHLIEVVVEGAEEVRENVTVEIPAAEDKPGLLARLAPGAGPAWLLPGLLVVVLVRRRWART